MHVLNMYLNTTKYQTFLIIPKFCSLKLSKMDRRIYDRVNNGNTKDTTYYTLLRAVHELDLIQAIHMDPIST